MSRWAIGFLIVTLMVAPLWSGCTRATQVTPAVEAVFLIVIDTLRPDRLSCYGYRGHQTLSIDALAESGVRFERAQSVASWTVPSMGALMTSRYPTQLGLVESPPNEAKRFEWREKRRQIRYTLPQGVPTLAMLLDDAGFYPVAFVNQPFINVKDGFLQGFAQWCYTTGEKSLEWHDTTTPIPSIEFPKGTDLGQADALLVEEFDKWLAENNDRRPFVWLHLLKPHWPYTPQMAYLSPQQRSRGARLDPPDLYLAEVRESDEMVGAVLAAIDKHVGLDKSLIILTSDHGEEFLEHGTFEHGHSLHREVIHVPLIISGPSVPVGKKVATYTQSIDLLPTILSLVGASELLPENVEGENLVSIMHSGGGDHSVYSEAMLYGSTERSLIEEGFKLMFDPQAQPQYRLYRVSNDAAELRDVSAGEASRVERMSKTIRDRHLRYVSDYESLMGPDAVEASAETQRILRAMRALGYVSD